MADLKGFIASVFVKRQKRDKGVKENQTVQLGGRFRPAAALDYWCTLTLSSIIYSSDTSEPCEPWKIKSYFQYRKFSNSGRYIAQ